jgi:Tfp pilus assembly protein PilN
MRVNLLPYQMAQKAGPNWRGVFTLAGVALLAAVTLIFYGALQVQVTRIQKDLITMEQDYEQYEPALGRLQLLQDLQARRDAMTRFTESLPGMGVRWNLIMGELRDIIPATVVLEDVISDPATGVIALSGRSGSLQALAQFMVAIQKAEYVTQPDIRNATRNLEVGFFEFIMTCLPKVEGANPSG